MSTTQEVTTAWDTAIWQHDDVTAFTRAIYNYEVIEDGQIDLNKLRDGNQINFIIYQVTRSPLQLQIARSRNYNYQVRITIVREYDKAGVNQRKIRETLEAIDALVHSELTQNWGGTVTLMTETTDFPELEEITIESVPCFRSTVVYQAAKHFVA